MKKYAKNKEGFTLIEVLVASFILIVGILGLASVLIASIKYNEANQKRVAAQQIVQGLTSELRGVDIFQFTKTNLVNNFGFSSSIPSGYPTGGIINSNCPADYEYKLYKTDDDNKTVDGVKMLYRYTIKLCVDDNYLTPYLQRAIVTIYWLYGGKVYNIASKMFITPGVGR